LNSELTTQTNWFPGWWPFHANLLVFFSSSSSSSFFLFLFFFFFFYFILLSCFLVSVDFAGRDLWDVMQHLKSTLWESTEVRKREEDDKAATGTERGECKVTYGREVGSILLVPCSDAVRQ
jgi:hypothetical protein